jgi:hypothetical protein
MGASQGRQRQPERRASSSTVAEKAEAMAREYAATIASETPAMRASRSSVDLRAAGTSLEQRDEMYTEAGSRSFRGSPRRTSGLHGGAHSAPQMRRSGASPAVQAPPAVLCTFEELVAEAAAKEGAPSSEEQVNMTLSPSNRRISPKSSPEVIALTPAPSAPSAPASRARAEPPASAATTSHAIGAPAVAPATAAAPAIADYAVRHPPGPALRPSPVAHRT